MAADAILATWWWLRGGGKGSAQSRRALQAREEQVAGRQRVGHAGASQQQRPASSPLLLQAALQPYTSHACTDFAAANCAWQLVCIPRRRTSADENSRKAYPLLLPLFLLRDSRTLVTLPNCEKYSAWAARQGQQGLQQRCRRAWRQGLAAADHQRPPAAGRRVAGVPRRSHL